MKQIVMMLGIAAALTGCGKKSTGDDAAPRPQRYNGTSFSLVDLGSSKWESPCAQIDGKDRSGKTVITFEENTFESAYTNYNGTTCDEGQKRATFRDRNYNVRIDTTEQLAGWKTFGYLVDGIYLELHMEELVMAYNEYQNYGLSGWELNQGMDVTGRQFSKDDDKERDRDSAWQRTMKMDGDKLYFAKYENNQPVEDYNYFLTKVQ